ncbi:MULTISPECIES: CCC motif membrane protein [Cellulophaga]|uniref:Uncharacterized protein n=1 Tax=Cellulophaga baltica TaxID=76594 RepID=A0A1G7IJF7_9FLAO|nr:MULTISPECIES: CCC motif membrane protein [Cellulophaga]AIY13560.1 membrane protein [Cellulophaga baltica NN016038]KGK30744.1 membrane protein [Cellulophaga sp. E6(2014)]MBA6315115.1 DUF4190 domain-containing protein [Cellulophaga baltica]MCR1026875.1 CCC motif membrane protein [Cellulophaga baltica]SDF12851.1 hypothetical protein SAMN04487992_107288 [Cellulophaga baltica]
MEQQKLPNATMIIVLSIFGYLCCCLAGIGIIPSGIAFFMANKSQKIYEESPELYDNYGTIKTGKIVAIIALVLNVLMVIRWIYVIATGGFDTIQEQYDEMMRQMEAAQ